MFGLLEKLIAEVFVLTALPSSATPTNISYLLHPTRVSKQVARNHVYLHPYTPDSDLAHTNSLTAEYGHTPANARWVPGK